MSEQYTPFAPPVGINVHWFAQAEKNEPPQAATVIGYSNQRTIEVMVFPRRGAVRTKIAVPHVDDPQLERIEVARRIMHGGWDFIPGCPHDPREPVPAPGEVIQPEGEVPPVDLPPVPPPVKRKPGRPRKEQPLVA
jgi:hypothetical protein